jgi:hypothetical protein
MYVPGLTFPTLKLPEATPDPPVILQAPFKMTPPFVGLDKLHVLSANENPEPDTETLMPVLPAPGFRTIWPLVTMKVASTLLGPDPPLPPEPLTRTEYEPGAMFPTTKLPVKADHVFTGLGLVVITQDHVFNDMPLPDPPPILHEVSLPVGITPETVTSVPDGPEDGLIVIELVAVPTTKVADAVSPLFPVAITV